MAPRGGYSTPLVSHALAAVFCGIVGILVVPVGARGADRGWDAAQVRHTQEILKERGAYSGPLDGRFGPKTREAICGFQRITGLPVSCALDDATLQRLDRPPDAALKVPGSGATARSPIEPDPDVLGGSIAGEPSPSGSENVTNVVAMSGALTQTPTPLAMLSKADATTPLAPDGSTHAATVILFLPLILYFVAILVRRSLLSKREERTAPSEPGIDRSTALSVFAEQIAHTTNQTKMTVAYLSPSTLIAPKNEEDLLGVGMSMPDIICHPSLSQDSTTCGRTSSCQNLAKEICPLRNGPGLRECVAYVGFESTTEPAPGDQAAPVETGRLLANIPEEDGTIIPAAEIDDCQLKEATAISEMEHSFLSTENIPDDMPVSPPLTTAIPGMLERMPSIRENKKRLKSYIETILRESLRKSAINISDVAQITGGSRTECEEVLAFVVERGLLTKRQDGLYINRVGGRSQRQVSKTDPPRSSGALSTLPRTSPRVWGPIASDDEPLASAVIPASPAAEVSAPPISSVTSVPMATAFPGPGLARLAYFDPTAGMNDRELPAYSNEKTSNQSGNPETDQLSADKVVVQQATLGNEGLVNASISSVHHQPLSQSGYYDEVAGISAEFRNSLAETVVITGTNRHISIPMETANEPLASAVVPAVPSPTLAESALSDPVDWTNLGLGQPFAPSPLSLPVLPENNSDRLSVLGGSLGSQGLNPDSVQVLAKRSSENELRVDLLGTIKTSAMRIAGVLQAHSDQINQVPSAFPKVEEAILENIATDPPRSSAPSDAVPVELAIGSVAPDGSTRDFHSVLAVASVAPLATAVVPASPVTAAVSVPVAIPATSAPYFAALEHGDAVDWTNFSLVQKINAPPLSQPSWSGNNDIANWVAKGNAITVGGMVIEGGLIYVGSRLPRLSGYSGNDNCLINPDLPIRPQSSPFIVARLPYYPAYGALDPVQRWAYLDWLAGGRNDPGAEIGLVFLFFYGLERRLIGERSEADRGDIVTEVERLRGVYGANPSFARYSGDVLAAARILDGAIPDQPPLMQERCDDLPLDLKVGLGRVVANTSVLSAEWMLVWLMCDQQLRWRTSAQRAGQEFRTLFLRRFVRDYPQGMMVTVPKQQLELLSPRYRAASGSFDVPLLAATAVVPDITTLRAPLDKGREIAARCMDDLDAISRFLGKFPERRNSLDAYLLLPQELRDHEPEAMVELRSWITETVAEPAALVPLIEVLRRVQGVVPEKLNRRDIQELAVKLAVFGIGLEPDPAFGTRFSRPDEGVALFRLGESPATMPSSRWQGAVLTLALAVTVAYADGHLAPQERELLHAHVAAAEGMSDSERRRLAAHLHWLLAHPPSLAELRARTTGLPMETRREIGHLAVAVAAADGVIDPLEVKLLSKLYRALGLAPESIYGELHAFATAAADVTASVPPAAPEVSASIQLDIDRIRRIRADTARVSAVLSTVFVDEVPPEPAPIPVIILDPVKEDMAVTLYPGLDATHCELLRELAAAEHWARGDYERLARSLDLMPSGALEVINDWSFEHFDEAVLEDDDDILVNLALLSSPQAGPSSYV